MYVYVNSDDPPLVSFIKTALLGSDLTRGQLAVRMGYANASKALRHLDHLLDGREVPPSFHVCLATALDIAPAAYEVAMTAMRDWQREEKRKYDEARIEAARLAFEPHLRVLPSRRIPQPIFVAAMTGIPRWLIAPLPCRIIDLAPIPRILAVGAAARSHFAQAHGSAGPFGRIEGYLFRYEWEKAFRLDTEGIVIEPHDGSIPLLGSATLSIGHKVIPPSLWTQYRT